MSPKGLYGIEAPPSHATLHDLVHYYSRHGMMGGSVPVEIQGRSLGMHLKKGAASVDADVFEETMVAYDGQKSSLSDKRMVGQAGSSVVSSMAMERDLQAQKAMGSQGNGSRQGENIRRRSSVDEPGIIFSNEATSKWAGAF